MVRTKGGLTSSKSVDKHGHLVSDVDSDDRSILYM